MTQITAEPSFSGTPAPPRKQKDSEMADINEIINTRNLNPTPEARVAMHIWCEEYAAQRGGSMDFWDNLPESRKARCRNVVHELLEKGQP